MNLAARLFSFFVIFSFYQLSIAQIQSVAVSAKTATQYSPNDTIYAFKAGISPSSLQFIASAPGGVNADFEWSQFDTTNKAFDPPIFSETNKITSIYTLPNSGGYKVRIFNGSGLDTTFTFWTFIDSISTQIEKNTDGTVYRFNYTCDYIDLLITSNLNKFTYFNPLTKERIVFPNTIKKYEWSADPAPDYLPKPKASGNLRISTHPTEDTYYTVVITDTLGVSATDEALFKAIVPKADFEPNYEQDANGKNSAPLNVTITNNSKNVNKYTWYTGLSYPDPDTVYTEDVGTLIYKEPKTYTIKLITESMWHCIDSVSRSFEVAPPEISTLKAFSPDGDGTNEVFKIDNVSIGYYNLRIFSRWGRQVYEESGFNANEWKGWNGNLAGGSKASPGIYYYVLEIRTFEKKPSIPLVYKDFFYLFRGKE